VGYGKTFLSRENGLTGFPVQESASILYCPYIADHVQYAAFLASRNIERMNGFAEEKTSEGRKRSKGHQGTSKSGKLHNTHNTLPWLIASSLDRHP
jgi:hypothetical protein